MAMRPVTVSDIIARHGVLYLVSAAISRAASWRAGGRVPGAPGVADPFAGAPADRYRLPESRCGGSPSSRTSRWSS
jgi:hypothetical protein